LKILLYTDLDIRPDQLFWCRVLGHLTKAFRDLGLLTKAFRDLGHNALPRWPIAIDTTEARN